MKAPLLENSHRAKGMKKLGLLLTGSMFLGVMAYLYIFSSAHPKHFLRMDIEESEFLKFIEKYSKEYSTQEEYSLRLQIFKENLEKIRSFNKENKSFSLGVNSMADLSLEEYRSKYLTTLENTDEERMENVSALNVSVPSSIDWKSKITMSPVKNRQNCQQADWAFAVTEAVESAWAIKGNPFIQLSVQQLLDCSKSEGNKGCSGGYVSYAYGYIMKKGITEDRLYQYKEYDGKCDTQKESQSKAKISRANYIRSGDENAMLNQLVDRPIVVYVDGENLSWQFFADGMYTDPCDVDQNSVLLVVGFNLDSSPPYWIAKNSLGTDWGDKGYVKIPIEGGDGKCGINQNPSYPII